MLVAFVRVTKMSSDLHRPSTLTPGPMTTTVTIKTLDGAEHILHSTESSRSVAELVEQELHCAASQYRLIPSPSTRCTYILVPTRPRTSSVAESTLQGPSTETIAQATSHFTAPQTTSHVQPAVMQEVIIWRLCTYIYIYIYG